MRFFLSLSLILLFSYVAIGQTKHETIIEDYRKGWNKLIPTQAKGQFAGSMGMISAGVGWDHGKRRRWETNVYLGMIPGNKYEEGHVTMTIKETYTPFRIHLGKDYQLEPLTIGLYMNKIFGEYFWAKLPERYPKGYYFWAVNTRINASLGQSFTIPCNSKQFSRSISAFYEVSTNDLYLISYIGNDYLKLKDIIGLSIGVRFRFFD